MCQRQLLSLYLNMCGYTGECKFIWNMFYWNCQSKSWYNLSGCAIKTNSDNRKDFFVLLIMLMNNSAVYHLAAAAWRDRQISFLHHCDVRKEDLMTVKWRGSEQSDKLSFDLRKRSCFSTCNPETSCRNYVQLRTKGPQRS